MLVFRGELAEAPMLQTMRTRPGHLLKVLYHARSLWLVQGTEEVAAETLISEETKEDPGIRMACSWSGIRTQAEPKT